MFYNENWVFYKVGLTKLKNSLSKIGEVITSYKEVMRDFTKVILIDILIFGSLWIYIK
tara:strand:+ start:47 stop:220 length:174 start_codon:yes stop_codon:yes gene_type:complete